MSKPIISASRQCRRTADTSQDAVTARVLFDKFGDIKHIVVKATFQQAAPHIELCQSKESISTQAKLLNSRHPKAIGGIIMLRHVLTREHWFTLLEGNATTCFIVQNLCGGKHCCTKGNNVRKVLAAFLNRCSACQIGGSDSGLRKRPSCEALWQRP